MNAENNTELTIEQQKVRKLGLIAEKLIQESKNKKLPNLVYKDGIEHILKMRENNISWVDIFKVVNNVYNLTNTLTIDVIKKESMKMSKQVNSYLKATGKIKEKTKKKAIVKG